MNRRVPEWRGGYYLLAVLRCGGTPVRAISMTTIQDSVTERNGVQL